MKKHVLVIAMFLLGWATHSFAGNLGKLSGMIFSDAYWYAESDQSANKGQFGFWLRRTFFTYENDLSDSFSVRLRLDMTSNDFGSTQTKISPSINEVYLKYAAASHGLFLGISMTPAIKVDQDLWGYRSVEKVPIHLWGLGSNRDFGVAARGRLFGEKLVYHAMYGNNEGLLNESDRHKKAALSLSVPFGGFVFEAYGDYEDSGGRYLLKGFVGYGTKSFRTGIQYAFKRNSPVSNVDLVSFFGAAKVTKNLWALLRFDKLFDVPLSSPQTFVRQALNAKPSLLLVGMDYAIASNIHLIPNVETLLYEGASVSADLIARVTLAFNFGG